MTPHGGCHGETVLSPSRDKIVEVCHTHTPPRKEKDSLMNFRFSKVDIYSQCSFIAIALVGLFTVLSFSSIYMLSSQMSTMRVQMTSIMTTYGYKDNISSFEQNISELKEN